MSTKDNATKEVLSRICPTPQTHKFITKHGYCYCARCGLKQSNGAKEA